MKIVTFSYEEQLKKKEKTSMDFKPYSEKYAKFDYFCCSINSLILQLFLQHLGLEIDETSPSTLYFGQIADCTHKAAPNHD